MTFFLRVLSLRARFFIAGALVTLLMAVTGYACAFMFARVSRVVGEELQKEEASSELVVTLTGSLEDEDDSLLLALSGDHQSAEKNRQIQQKKFDDALALLDAKMENPREHALLSALAKHVVTYRKSGDRLIAQTALDDARAVYDADTTPALRAATEDCDRIRDLEVQSSRKTAAWARDESHRATMLVFAVSFVCLTLSILVAMLLARSIVRPISELTKNMKAVCAGAFDKEVLVHGDDEISALAVGYNEMVRALSLFSAKKLEEVTLAKELVEATLSALPDAVMLVGAAGQIESANPRATLLLASVSDKAPTSLASLAETKPGAALVRAVLDGCEPSRAADLSRAVRVGEGEGERRFLSRVTSFGHDSASSVVVFRDVTDLARLDEMRMDFVAAASHELRTPLTTLKMMLSMIAETRAPRSSHEDEMVRAALMGCEQLGQTVDAMLDLARAETGDIRLRLERVHVAQVVNDAVRSFSPRYADLGATLSYDGEADDAEVAVDISRLSVVLSNILTNALKYSAPDDHVVVAVDARPDYVEVSVTDEGGGIPAEFRERVFEKYFRVEHHREGKNGHQEHGPRGAGIGLYLCKQIVDAHGGQIRCEEGPRGVGTRIVVRLARVVGESISAEHLAEHTSDHERSFATLTAS